MRANATITGSISAYDGKCSCDCSDCWASWTPCGRVRKPRCSGVGSAAALCVVWGWAWWRGFCRKRRRYSIHPGAVGCRVTGAIISSRGSPTVGPLLRLFSHFFFVKGREKRRAKERNEREGKRPGFVNPDVLLIVTVTQRIGHSSECWRLYDRQRWKWKRKKKEI